MLCDYGDDDDDGKLEFLESVIEKFKTMQASGIKQHYSATLFNVFGGKYLKTCK